ncbi:hypothetical protein [Paracoccus pacificus]|uniref:Component of SufBCD complex n=1 Tax=Paracoccus pacificus TaxID=1463598 RepID=A0ABW4R5N8_9RHOB
MDAILQGLPNLETRSFAAVWFWLFLVLCWSLMGRGVLGVPAEVIARARFPADGPDGDEARLLLLDWLSLTLPMRQTSPGVAVFALAAGGFVLAALAVLALLGVEIAQAGWLLLTPLAVTGVLRVRLAGRMQGLMEAAQTEQVPPAEAAERAARALWSQRLITSVIGVIAMGVTAAWGALWMLRHPLGF